MTAVLRIFDETTLGEKIAALELDFPARRITVKELIRKRVYEEVKKHNNQWSPVFKGLVQPADTEETPKGYIMKSKKNKPVDWEKQYKAALEAFQTNRVIILIDDKQAEDLDQVFDIHDTAEVSFLKIVPLVGG